MTNWTGLASKRLSTEANQYLEEVRGHLVLPNKVPRTPKNYFYAAFSYIRVHSPAAVAELERSAADYKLFRSLAVVFPLDILLSVLFGTWSAQRIAISFGLLGLALFRFHQLFVWTYALAFDLYLRVREHASSSAP